MWCGSLQAWSVSSARHHRHGWVVEWIQQHYLAASRGQDGITSKLCVEMEGTYGMYAYVDRRMCSAIEQWKGNATKTM